MRKITVKRVVKHCGVASQIPHYVLSIDDKPQLAIRIVKHEWPGLGGSRTFLVYDYNEHRERLASTVWDLYKMAHLSTQEMDATYAPYDWNTQKPLPSVWPDEWFKEM